VPGSGNVRWALLGSIAVLAGFAWVIVLDGAGMGMSTADMTVLSFFPHLQPDAQFPMQSHWLAIAGMWLVMMLAMMTPAAVPLVMLGGRVMQHHGRESEWRASAPFIVAGYLASWAAFALAAAGLQAALEPAGMLSPMLLWSRNAYFSATLLVLAGAYQLSPLKDACLAQCRSPAAFLMQHWSAGARGGFLLGLRHGAFCVGCCWLLMTLLFVFGVMNVIWIAALSLLVLAEKLARGPYLSRACGAVLLAWGGATLVVQAQPAMAPMPGMAQPAKATPPAYTSAKILSVDAGRGLVELQHNEIVNLGMPAMTMFFQVKDPRLIENVKPGDAVEFRAAHEGGNYLVIDLKPAAR
jgi:predicted metal-binding membrane protein